MVLVLCDYVTKTENEPQTEKMSYTLNGQRFSV